MKYTLREEAMEKKRLIILLCIVMALSLIACGKEKGTLNPESDVTYNRIETTDNNNVNGNLNNENAVIRINNKNSSQLEIVISGDTASADPSDQSVREADFSEDAKNAMQNTERFKISGKYLVTFCKESEPNQKPCRELDDDYYSIYYSKPYLTDSQIANDSRLP